MPRAFVNMANVDVTAVQVHTGLGLHDGLKKVENAVSAASLDT